MTADDAALRASVGADVDDLAEVAWAAFWDDGLPRRWSAVRSTIQDGWRRSVEALLARLPLATTGDTAEGDVDGHWCDNCNGIAPQSCLFNPGEGASERAQAVRDLAAGVVWRAMDERDDATPGVLAATMAGHVADSLLADGLLRSPVAAAAAVPVPVAAGEETGAAIDAVLHLHALAITDSGLQHCGHDGQVWPCDTVRAVAGGLDHAPGGGAAGDEAVGRVTEVVWIAIGAELRSWGTHLEDAELTAVAKVATRAALSAGGQA